MSAEVLQAIARGDREALRRMVREDPALARAKGADGVSAILLALYRGHAEIADDLRPLVGELDVFEAAAMGDTARVRALVGRERSLADAYAPDGFTPLGLAAYFRRPEVVRLLLESGADPNRASRNAFAVAPLHSAVADGCDREIAMALIEAGADVNARQRHGWTPLHGAAHAGDLALVRALLERGAEGAARNDAGQSPLDVARERGHAGVAEVLAQRATRA